jgi:hypothetical protein
MAMRTPEDAWSTVARRRQAARGVGTMAGSHGEGAAMAGLFGDEVA